MLELSELEQLRNRLRRMSLEQLISFGKFARIMSMPTFGGQPAREVWRIQLREAREEYRRRKKSP